MKLVIKGGSISHNHNVGLFIDGDADVSIDGTAIEGNHGFGVLARSSQIPADMLEAIRDAAAKGQTPKQIEETFGDRLKSLGKPIGDLVQAGANVAKIFEYLQS